METRARYIIVGLFTLAVVAAGFGFVLWLNNSGGLGKRALYRVRFDAPVSGLQTGAAVRFNGIRVGEVTDLQLDREHPERITATVAIANDTPLRADTTIGVDFQGLMGTPAISLRGGTAGSPAPTGTNGAPALFVADPSAGQDLTQTARQALQHVDKILGDNAESVKATMESLRTFSAALARNSDRIDGVMAGLEHLAGGGPVERPKPLYDLTAPAAFPSLAGLRRAQVSVPEVTAVVAFETQRLLSRSLAGEIAPLGDAQWSDSLPKLTQAKIIQSFENAGFLATTSPVDRVTAKYQLLVDLRNFAVTPATEPLADIEFAARIVADDGHIVDARLFHATSPARGTDAPSVVAAFNQAFGKVAVDLVTWASEAFGAGR